MSHMPRRKCHGHSKDGILEPSGFSLRLSPYSLHGKGESLPAHVQLGFRKNLWPSVCSDEILMCVTKACVKTRFPITAYSVIPLKFRCIFVPFIPNGA